MGLVVQVSLDEPNRQNAGTGMERMTYNIVVKGGKLYNVHQLLGKSVVLALSPLHEIGDETVYSVVTTLPPFELKDRLERLTTDVDNLLGDRVRVLEAV